MLSISQYFNILLFQSHPYNEKFIQYSENTQCLSLTMPIALPIYRRKRYGQSCCKVRNCGPNPKGLGYRPNEPDTINL